VAGSSAASLSSALHEDTDPELVSTVVSLIEEAGEPYSAWFFGGRAKARADLGKWLLRPSSEVSATRVELVHEDPRSLAGLFIGVPGAELESCRKSDLLVAVASAHDAEARNTLAARIRQTSDLFLEVEPDEYYLSKMAVVRERRGRGLGRLILDAFLAKGERHGYTRFSLDVAAENTPAVKLYASAGFREQGARERAGMRYLRMTFNQLTLAVYPVLKGFEWLAAAG
jgi:GNAT superfamily N-acetyltransferase